MKNQVMELDQPPPVLSLAGAVEHGGPGRQNPPFFSETARATFQGYFHIVPLQYLTVSTNPVKYAILSSRP